MARGTILIADDDTAIRTVLNQALARAGYALRATGNAATLWRWVSGRATSSSPTSSCPTRTLRADPAHQAAAPRPADHRDERTEHADDGADRGREGRLRVPAEALRPERARVGGGRAPRSPAVRRCGRCRRSRARSCRSSAARRPCRRSTVLARLYGRPIDRRSAGESGTGKELVARVLHDYGKRRQARSWRSTWPPFRGSHRERLRPREGRLHRRAGAHARPLRAGGGRHPVPRRDRRHAARGDAGLRVLQEGEYTTVGGRTPIKTNVRIIAATHRDLKAQIQQGFFREDLFYRLNGAAAHPAVARAQRGHRRPGAISCARPREGLGQKSIETAAIDRLKAHPWPGNVRELENFVAPPVAL